MASLGLGKHILLVRNLDLLKVLLNLRLTLRRPLECIAASTKRPLMTLTASDIGVDPDDIESNLAQQFRTAKSWGAVLLIDEADIFMERRTSSDLVRNSLVAGNIATRPMPWYMQHMLN